MRKEPHRGDVWTMIFEKLKDKIGADAFRANWAVGSWCFVVLRRISTLISTHTRREILTPSRSPDQNSCCFGAYSLSCVDGLGRRCRHVQETNAGIPRRASVPDSLRHTVRPYMKVEIQQSLHEFPAQNTGKCAPVILVYTSPVQNNYSYCSPVIVSI